MYETKNKNENNDFVKLTKIRWSNLKDKIKIMSEDEKKIEQPDKLLKIDEEILNFNKKMQKQSGKGLKVLTPDQMLSRLKAGNSSEKLNNGIRQLLYSLYRSNKLAKQLYKMEKMETILI